MRLSEELARIAGRRKRRPADQAPREIIPTEPPAAFERRQAPRDPFDAARDRLRSQIPPRDEQA